MSRDSIPTAVVSRFKQAKFTNAKKVTSSIHTTDSLANISKTEWLSVKIFRQKYSQ